MSGQIVVVGEGAVTNDVAGDETVRIETRLAIRPR